MVSELVNVKTWSTASALTVVPADATLCLVAISPPPGHARDGWIHRERRDERGWCGPQTAASSAAGLAQPRRAVNSRARGAAPPERPALISRRAREARSR